ncbi:MAG: hypothetical protein WAV31_02780 [Candidatus Moraniibacteriota bacterium]
MNLSLASHISIHIFVSLCVGLIVWRIWRKFFCALSFALVGGFLIDFDHFIDYYLAFGWDWKWLYFRNGYEFLKSGKVYVLFHGWEYVVILILLACLFKNKYLKTVFFSLALGLFFHLVTDVIVDKTPIKSYFLTYRIKNNFENKQIINDMNYELYLKKKAWVKFE